jgi:precorrin-2/cobalt-factor-2 C20-methyltransferase
MKAGRGLDRIKPGLAGRSVFLVENCGMPDEKIYAGVEALPDETGYFSLLIVR